MESIPETQPAGSSKKRPALHPDYRRLEGLEGDEGNFDSDVEEGSSDPNARAEAVASLSLFPSSDTLSCVLAVLALVLAALTFGMALRGSGVLQQETNRCDMTYMYPTYVPVTMPPEVSDVKMPYSLYLYQECRGLSMDALLEYGKGIPVLFVAGNGGSYKQARSLGSVLAKIGTDDLTRSIVEPCLGNLHEPNNESGKTQRRFDVYTIDFNEDLSAFSGVLLWEQTRFVANTIKFLRAKYGDESNVVVVGHSMGGVVARGVLSMDTYTPGDVHTIITLASPHLRPPIPYISDVAAYYQLVNSYWTSPSLARDVLVVSYSGGSQDVQIESDSTHMSRLVPMNQHVSIPISALPYSYANADHLCLVWCRHAVNHIAQSLFRTIRDEEMAVDVEKRRDAFLGASHLKHEDGTIERSSNECQVLLESADEVKGPEFHLHTMVSGSEIYMIRRPDDSEYTEDFEESQAPYTKFGIVAESTLELPVDVLFYSETGRCIDLSHKFSRFPQSIPAKETKHRVSMTEYVRISEFDYAIVRVKKRLEPHGPLSIVWGLHGSRKSTADPPAKSILLSNFSGSMSWWLGYGVHALDLPRGNTMAIDVDLAFPAVIRARVTNLRPSSKVVYSPVMAIAGDDLGVNELLRVVEGGGNFLVDVAEISRKTPNLEEIQRATIHVSMDPTVDYLFEAWVDVPLSAILFVRRHYALIVRVLCLALVSFYNDITYRFAQSGEWERPLYPIARLGLSGQVWATGIYVIWGEVDGLTGFVVVMLGVGALGLLALALYGILVLFREISCSKRKENTSDPPLWVDVIMYICLVASNVVPGLAILVALLVLVFGLARKPAHFAYQHLIALISLVAGLLLLPQSLANSFQLIAMVWHRPLQPDVSIVFMFWDVIHLLTAAPIIIASFYSRHRAPLADASPMTTYHLPLGLIILSAAVIAHDESTLVLASLSMLAGTSFYHLNGSVGSLSKPSSSTKDISTEPKTPATKSKDT